jgi:hypothetical protein
MIRGLRLDDIARFKWHFLKQIDISVLKQELENAIREATIKAIGCLDGRGYRHVK